MSFTLKPAIDKEFFNREELMDELLTTLTNPKIEMGFALVGARRVGKTSIFLELTRRLKKHKKIVPVYFSMWELLENSTKEFCYTLSHKIIDAYKEILGIKYRIKNALALPVSAILSILKTTDLKIKIFDEIELALSTHYTKQEFIVDLIRKTLLLTEELAQKTKTRCVLIIDEFPSIMELKNGKALGMGIIKIIRTINETYRHTIFNISGSIRKTMESTVLSSSSPFYRQFIIKNILPFEKRDVHTLLKTNLKRDIGPDIIDYIYNETKGIPFYVQFIGRKLLQKGRDTLNIKLVTNCITEFIQEEGNLIFSEEFFRVSPKEKAILLVMSRHEESSVGEIAKETKENLNAVGRYLEYLMHKGFIAKKERGIYLLNDPMLRKWIESKDIF